MYLDLAAFSKVNENSLPALAETVEFENQVDKNILDPSGVAVDDVQEYSD